METPSSTRRVTRSQTLASNASAIPNSKKSEESEKKGSELRARNGKVQQERSAMMDISNDSSPIVGLTAETLETPLSSMSKKMVNSNSQSKHSKTPGSGEALLRGQVKTLLQKVEEEAELSKFPFDQNPSITPQMIDGKKEEEVESDKGMVVTRSLLSDFSTEKSEAADSSSDRSSIWSIQVNASVGDEDEDEKSVVDDDEDVCDDYYEEEEEDEWGRGGGLIDELCEGIGKMSVKAKFAGKHTRFVYNSDGELEGVEEESAAAGGAAAALHGALHLKGLPTPKGKHIRFSEEDN
ncbi:PREDICTED: putative DNA helicase INO80 [Ipomoea nil]|uniref:putative DNA helicase INO80 n=1 Tax=Ipomoea nil TaxID=35883 RepID=UPI000900C943|nr:PREDICTED: putative DNA helicase INO80 [Ipomoea nil]